MILNGVYDKYFGYSFEMFWLIELNAGEIITINTNEDTMQFKKDSVNHSLKCTHWVTKGLQNKDTI